MKIPRTTVRDQGYAGPAERNMADRRRRNQLEMDEKKAQDDLEAKHRAFEPIERQREERLRQKAIDDFEITKRDFLIIERSLEEKLKKAESALAEKEASLKAMEVEMNKLNEELLGKPSQKAKAVTTTTKKRITGKVLLSLNSQWRSRWNHLLDMRKEARDRGEVPVEMFLEERPEAKRIERKWEIRQKARSSKYAMEI